MLVVALAFALGDGGYEGGMLILIFGMVPGLATGAVLGAIAGLMPAAHPILRWCVLAIPAVAAVWLLGTFFVLDELIIYASIPTLAVATILERKTRAKPEAPIPVARAN